MAIDGLLKIEGLDLRYGSSHVLHEVDLTVGTRPLGILGRNGMGKTSLCNAIMGLHAHAAGEIWFDGVALTGLAPEKRAQLGIGYVPQGRRVFRSLTVEEHLRIVERRGGDWSVDRVYETFPRLKERRRNLGDRLSGGEQQMLAIGRALLLNPKLIVMDEPTEGLAPAIVSDVIDLIALIAREGIAVMLVEQNMHAALAAVQDVAIMVGGEVVERMSAEALEADTAMQKRHLGLEPGQAG
ncbi:ABC transporter ATP-binding protein [Shimia sp. R10_1]|uniref:ABC transporter ATP-binding protein n=1 Tax=Shimia sp. R10_1 TaxID=2821095 RepID=UPI001ADA9BB3|nr:ABC transporter ATP-binding protein [Shimia sp. R10_1]MBO9475211.1 ABC transporter ATP-binding protein [Shimia sp. R10_1]